MRLFLPHPLPFVRPDNAGYAYMASKLIDRLADVRRQHFEHALWVSPLPAPDLTKDIGTLVQSSVLTEGDLDYFAHSGHEFDLIIVCGLLDNVHDLPGALMQIRCALKPDGLFLASLCGGESLRELRSAIGEVDSQMRGSIAPRIHPMVDLLNWAALLQRAGFALPVADSDIQTVHYKQLHTLLCDLKEAGGLRLKARDNRFAGKNFWPQVEDVYRRKFASEDGLLQASFEVLFGIGWGHSHNQQQPLRPGSAKLKLADALGGVEVPLPR